MWARAKYILLPLLGALAAVIAFQLAAPYEASLAHPGIQAADPASHFTYGTKWGEVNRLSFGAILCGSFSLVLSLGRRVWWRAILAGLVGAACGGALNYATDSGSDLLGIALSRVNPMLGQLTASAAWCILVPFGISMAIMVAMGPTRQRFSRAIVSTVLAAVTSYGAQVAVGTFAAPKSLEHGLEGLITPEGGLNLVSQIPIWRSEAIAVGFAIGLTMIYADQVARAGTVRLILGKGEYRDWSLDAHINRIGAAEGLEIPLWGFRHVAPEHGRISRSGSNFLFESVAPGATVNGRAMPSVVLMNGDTITVGDATLVFYTKGAARSALHQGRDSAPPRAATASAAVASVRSLVDASGGQFTLAPGTYEIGRDPGASIPLPNQSTVSRRHAWIQVGEHASQVTDLGSSNGTKVNGRRITGPTILQAGDVVEFGSARFTFR